MRAKSFFIALVAMLLPMVANAKKVVEIDGICYDLNDENATAEVVRKMRSLEYSASYNSYMGDVVIPSEVSYNSTIYSVTSIGDYAFSECFSLTSVTIPNSVTSIGKWAFYDCSDLTSVTIPNSVTYIGSQAFESCIGLTSVHITDIAAWCNINFSNDESNPLFYAHHLYLNGDEIKDLVIPNGVKSISAQAFYGFSGLTSVTIPNSVTSIGYGAFGCCNNILDVFCYMEKASKYFEDVFVFCGLYNITLHVHDYAIESFKALDLSFKGIVVFDKVTDFNLTYYVDGEMYKQVKYKYEDDITPEAEPTKEGYTFSGWNGVPETMPAHNIVVEGLFTVNNYKLTYMDDGREYKSYNIPYGSSTSVPENNPKKENYEFTGWDGLPETMPANDVVVNAIFMKVSTDIEGVKYKFEGGEACIIKNDASGYVNILSSFEDEGNTYTVTAIMDNAFKNNTSITSVLIPSTVTSIGVSAFNGCRALKSIEIGNGVTLIGERAFAGIDKLTDVTILAEEVPATDRTAFENSYIEDYVTLHVPENAIDKYMATAPWKNFMDVKPISIPETFRCATPTIVFKDGKIVFSCETEGVEYNYSIKSGISQEGKGNSISVTPSIIVTVYASKDGYDNSDITTKTIQISSSNMAADANGDGVVNAADIVTITNIIMDTEKQ